MQDKDLNKSHVAAWFHEHGINDFNRPIKDYLNMPKPGAVSETVPWGRININLYYWFKEHGFKYSQPIAENMLFKGERLQIKRHASGLRQIKNGYVGIITRYHKGGKWEW
jgi:hypothetical protein